MSLRRLALLPLLGAALLAAAGCGTSSQSAGRTTTAAAPAVTPTRGAAAAKASACLAVPEALNHKILTRVVLSGAHFLKIRAARAASLPGYYFVSGTVAGGGTKHLLATWATTDIHGGKPIWSVDANAALISEYGASTGESLTLDVGNPGSHMSRRCVDGAHADEGVSAPVSNGGGAPAGG